MTPVRSPCRRWSGAPLTTFATARCTAFCAALLTLLLGACAAGPDYQRPSSPAPAAYKENRDWKPAEPQDQIPRDGWWHIFADPVLDQLEAQVASGNFNLAASEAQYRQAEALADSARASWFPTVSAGLGETRSRSASISSGGTTTSVPNSIRTNRSFTLSATWEADLWGRIRRTVEANEASAQASAADLTALRLSLQATLAQDYFQLRIADEQQRLYEATVAAYRRSLEIVRNQYAAGVAAQADVLQAEAQLQAAQAQRIDLGIQRAQLEHAIALLIGKAPAEFSLPPAPLAVKLPQIPVGLPSQLLERRPDIAAAERRAAAANAQIGVASAAWFPSLTLNASGGFQSSSLAHWFTAPNRIWSVGPSLAETLFDGGKRSAASAQAIAGWDASVATYRQTVLTGLQEVEDNLVALRLLEEEAQAQNTAASSARKAAELAANQYQVGTVSYLNVATAQTSALTNERNAVTILGRRLISSITLIKAIGGNF